MGLNIKDPETERLAAEIATLTGESKTGAIRTALREMISLIVERYKLSRENAYILASDAADFSITQLVDGKRGVHAMIPKSIFTGR